MLHRLSRTPLAALSIALLSLSLVACGSAPKPAAPAPSPAQSGQSAASTQPFKGQTVVVTSPGGAWEEFMRKEIIPDFEQKTGAKLELAIGISKDWITKLRAAGKDNPPYDVVMANETWMSGARSEGYFTPLPLDKVPSLKDIEPSLRNKGDNGVLGIIFPLGIAYRTDLIKNPPKSWKDLWKPEYKGQLGLYSINNSATPMFIMLAGKAFGGDPKNMDVAFQKIKELKPFKQTDFSGDMEKLLTRGEVGIGILDAPSAARLRKQGVPLAFVAPEEGMFMFEQDFSVTSGSKHKDLAFAYVEYMLSQATQEKLARGFYITPGNVNVKIEGDLKDLVLVPPKDVTKILRWDWDWLNSGPKDQMTDRWNKEITG